MLTFVNLAGLANVNLAKLPLDLRFATFCDSAYDPLNNRHQQGWIVCVCDKSILQPGSEIPDIHHNVEEPKTAEESWLSHTYGDLRSKLCECGHELV